MLFHLLSSRDLAPDAVLTSWERGTVKRANKIKHLFTPWERSPGTFEELNHNHNPLWKGGEKKDHISWCAGEGRREWGLVVKYSKGQGTLEQRFYCWTFLIWWIHRILSEPLCEYLKWISLTSFCECQLLHQLALTHHRGVKVETWRSPTYFRLTKVMGLISAAAEVSLSFSPFPEDLIMSHNIIINQGRLSWV